MYRRATSGAFIVVTTFLIVVVMALFTWVIYGMARQVYTLTDTMVEMDKFLDTIDDAGAGFFPGGPSAAKKAKK